MGNTFSVSKMCRHLKKSTKYFTTMNSFYETDLNTDNHDLSTGVVYINYP